VLLFSLTISLKVAAKGEPLPVEIVADKAPTTPVVTLVQSPVVTTVQSPAVTTVQSPTPTVTSTATTTTALSFPVSATQITVAFTDMTGTGFDIGAGSEGDIYIIGEDRRAYVYNFLANTFSVVEGVEDMENLNRIDVDGEGTPYVLTNCGDTYYLNCFNNWVKLPGCGTDIGVGRGFDVWKVGCDARGPVDSNGNLNNFGIWKLFCKNECGGCSCNRGCIRFRPRKYEHDTTGDRRKCFWYRIEGDGVRIDVHPNGNPYVADNLGNINKYDGIDWITLGGVLGADLTLSNEGMLLVAGIDTFIYSLASETVGPWNILIGAGLEISAGPYSQPSVISTDSHAYTSAKLSFN